MKNILELLKEQVENGTITVRRAAEMLYKAGWTNFIDEEKTKELLKLEDKK